MKKIILVLCIIFVVFLFAVGIVVAEDFQVTVLASKGSPFTILYQMTKVIDDNTLITPLVTEEFDELMAIKEFSFGKYDTVEFSVIQDSESFIFIFITSTKSNFFVYLRGKRNVEFEVGSAE